MPVEVREIMSPDPVVLTVDDELSLAHDIMSLGRIRHLPVVEGSKLVGIISQRDLFRASLASVLGDDYDKNREHLKSIKIREIMVKNVISVSPGMSLQEAGRIMLKEKIGCLPVVEDEKLVGLITETDLLSFLIDHILPFYEKSN
ncbi:MAG TPA: CBS domain-containing protein [Deltaproteobacteria bacterium]|nr:MAG: hypothetical protein DRG59_11625 [Deltaproteobacteria bacterium]HDM75130.1 CBS domain-containing protein [Deltaproteobacteria bacterium]HEC32569.1 CBS domain-containing protein [Deltaproteobacteria bacterium]